VAAPVVAAAGVSELALAMCGDARAAAPVCMRPADSPNLADRWQTLITIAMTPGTGELHWHEGIPADIAESGFQVFG